MNKEQALAAIQRVRDSHEEQMNKVDTMVAGIYVKNPTEVSKIKCDFGKWLYNEDNHVREVLGAQFYENLDKLHTKWHEEYFKIYNMFFKKKKRTFVDKLFNIPMVNDMEVDKARLYFAELKVTTAQLMKVLDASQRRLAALSESKFSEL